MLRRHWLRSTPGKCRFSTWQHSPGGLSRQRGRRRLPMANRWQRVTTRPIWSPVVGRRRIWPCCCRNRTRCAPCSRPPARQPRRAAKPPRRGASYSTPRAFGLSKPTARRAGCARPWSRWHGYAIPGITHGACWSNSSILTGPCIVSLSRPHCFVATVPRLPACCWTRVCRSRRAVARRWSNTCRLPARKRAPA